MLKLTMLVAFAAQLTTGKSSKLKNFEIYKIITIYHSLLTSHLLDLNDDVVGN